MNGTIDYSVLENEQLAKLESGSRSNVQFKPSKKMKKRRQLDALVSNGKKLPRRKQSGHELLRSSDSDSSEVEEFSVLESQKWTKRWPNPGCCSTCYTVTGIVVVALCLLACGALVWMHLQLKHDFNQLKDRVDRVENKNAATPGELKALQSKLLSINKTVSGIRTGKYGLQDLNRTIVSMQKQITSQTPAELPKTAQSLEPNTKENQALEKTVADMGSNLQLAQKAVVTLKTSQKSFSSQLESLANRVLNLESSGGREHGSSSTSSPQLQELLSEINATFSRTIGLAMAKLDRQQSQLDAVDKFTQEVDNQVKNVSQAVSSLQEAQQHLTHLLTSQQSKAGTEGGSSGQGKQTQEQASLAQLQGQVQHLQLLLQQLQTSGNGSEKADNVSEVAANSSALRSLMKDHQGFVVFRTEMFQDVNYLNASLKEMNASVGVLNTDVEELFAKLGVAMSDITNITTVVEGLTHFLQAWQNTTRSQHSNSSQTTPASSTVPKTPGHEPSPAKPPGSARDTPEEPDSQGEGGTPGLMPEENTAGLSASEDNQNDQLKEGSQLSEGTGNTNTDNSNPGM